MYKRLPFAVYLILLLPACSHEQPKRVSEPVQAPVQAQIKVEEPVAIPKAGVKPPASDVVILLSSDIPAYNDVAMSIAARLGSRAHTWRLQASAAQNEKLLADIAKLQRSQVVAIGLDAAVIAKKLVDKQMIFCQVFNYEDEQLPSAMHKGVGMLPSFKKSFSAWKAISPRLKQIAIITGPGLNEYVSKAKTAAKAQGITVLHREVNSDMEFLMEYKSVANSVQGYWLWPDNRVLSGVVLREVLTFSMRGGKQVVVFNDELLELGGLISATADHKDIANNVIKRLQQAEGKPTVPGNVIEPLDVAHLRINSLMAQRLGLTVPNQYKKYLNAR